MIISETELRKSLQERYNRISSIYSNVFYMAIVGIGNYGFAEDTDKITYVAMRIPTFEELCTEESYVSEFEDVIVIDIRDLYNSIDTCKWGALELLYSDYMILNPKYKDIFTNKLMLKRDIIANCDKENRLEIVYSRAKEKIEKGEYFEAARLEIASNLYLKNVSCDNLFHLKEKYYTDYLWNIKSGKEGIDPTEILNKLEQYIQTAKEIDKSRDEADKIIKDTIISLVSASLEEQISINNFYDTLTKKEKDAFQYVLKELDENGIGLVSISKMVEQTGLSRPVYKNLMDKMEKAKVATIINQGVKGMRVEFRIGLLN